MYKTASQHLLILYISALQWIGDIQYYNMFGGSVWYFDTPFIQYFSINLNHTNFNNTLLQIATNVCMYTIYWEVMWDTIYVFVML